ncbi:MAG: heat-inducible transcriptional repressor HrcA [Oscillospiraceae bacterium]|nr:heat-inducible transcriptional repressor HrcA [Oscillospiraceae bacterium]MDY6208626.1 heat-inducible transcriptional repressor HrcA [Oscillospiraceae bacterium]
MMILLDERKLRILAAVVDEYIRTGEPVGSKTIAALPDIRVSSATIRNDMAMLEQLGFLEQPHTSAGRIPTYSGYKLYIETLMPKRALSDDEKAMLDEAIGEDFSSEEALIDNATRALAEITDCAAVVSNCAPQFSVIAKVDAVPTGKHMYVLLMITSSGSIQNKVCRLELDLTHEQLAFFNEYMTKNLSGMSVDSLSDETLERLAEAMGAYTVTLSPLMKGIRELAKGFMQSDVHVSGEKNLLKRNDIEAGDVIKFFEQKNEFSKLLDDSFSELKVLFGEDGGFVIGNSSMIVSPIKKGKRTAGSLGLIGPLRLDYAKVIPYIEYMTDRISELLSEDSEVFPPVLETKDDGQKG